MRLVAVLLYLLITSGSLAEEINKHQSVDWFFGCRKPPEGSTKESQPCWLQSAETTLQRETGGEPIGKLYFQIHFFTDRKVLRTYIEEPHIQQLQFIFFRKDADHPGVSRYLELKECTEKSCWGDLQIDDETIMNLIARGDSLGLSGKSADGSKNLWWRYVDVVTFEGLEEAFIKLHKHIATHGYK